MVQGLHVLLAPVDAGRVLCTYVVHIDMRAPLPAPMVQYATQRVVGMIFHKLRKAASQIRNGRDASTHAARIARDTHIYLEWMLPREVTSESEFW